MAVKDGNEQTVKFIVDSGAAIDIKDDSGVSDTCILTSPAVLSVLDLIPYASNKGCYIHHFCTGRY